ncbi:hypothetical protein [Mesorhizobium sp. M0571]|uniref:hypothetical protein n=1 Tax=Mesorhizobium sp. M0571 TaxID=2956960 RepID=UPI0033385AA0
MTYTLRPLSLPKKVMLLVSKFDHCLADLLNRSRIAPGGAASSGRSAPAGPRLHPDPRRQPLRRAEVMANIKDILLIQALMIQVLSCGAFCICHP